MPMDAAVDAYIARQADFARPILERLRAAVHAACDVDEAIKWSMPAFLYRGQILANMAAFKAHATFGFWRGAEVFGDTPQERSAMGQFGRLTSLDDLPEPAVLDALIRKAAALAQAGPKPRSKAGPKPPPETPAELQAALDGAPAAAATFAAFPPSCRREYVEWVAEAKRPETRIKRAAQAVEWMAEGKRRNWKYEGC
jgi:uncharacterized protein YdeI (YjbR/CyaY-like superfamily)